ncbi:hypothetical protein HBI56_211340 [Parastagonospora nodorum]|uniref:Uncharacterized protein n=2 Tax=Phaeosphaeria nodorum (strain SN15 / ATCC MYA-4574 / FGSC 10173) TaxID=321614 RepID=A0A7U2I114_PHANO|nr:hypothetical protein SNOG_15224 [Parastagonospora nodorum SN15]KAH3905748.1 hypothetical protein HBH56_213030 [Parastagonospora nodorum]EAT77449.1 hypothetical protein SNOG_15224 [Parastagonospora nodorum SN15]KAH3923031.1 hypothetical protein HBH54_214700 [Parastagonospora nodorum]KAH3961078.1 hypothetical protein HBH51_187210 [Parastagonospora nodorum]KAH4018287.1 hypothetical protein HBI09_192420 [Parastagonospora nodorum]
MPTLLTLVLCTLNFTIGILSITVLALVAHTLTLTSSPPYVRGTSRSILFWPGCGGIVDMILFIILWHLTPRESVGQVHQDSHEDSNVNADQCQEKKRKYFWNGLVFVASFIFGRPAVVLVYTFVEWGRAEKGDMMMGKGYFTTETWACAASQAGVEGAGSVCQELRAARYLLIPEVVLGAAILELVICMKSRFSGRKKPAEEEAASTATKA